MSIHKNSRLRPGLMSAKTFSNTRVWCQHASQNQTTCFDWQRQCQLTGLVWSSCSERSRTNSCCRNQLEFGLCQAVYVRSKASWVSSGLYFAKEGALLLSSVQFRLGGQAQRSTALASQSLGRGIPVKLNQQGSSQTTAVVVRSSAAVMLLCHQKCHRDVCHQYVLHLYSGICCLLR